MSFTLPASEQALLSKYNTTDREIKCRLVRVQLPEGGTEVLCTSIRNKLLLPYQCFAQLYHFRWNIEEGYKLFKCRLHLEAFSGKTAIAVKQDFFAKIFTITTAAVLVFPVDEKIRKAYQTNTQKHPHQVNRTTALSMVKEIATNVFIQKIINPAINALGNILQATTEIVRPNRKFQRKKIKKKPPSMNYKQL